jgi:hypothetical protein
LTEDENLLKPGDGNVDKSKAKFTVLDPTKTTGADITARWIAQLEAAEAAAKKKETNGEKI